AARQTTSSTRKNDSTAPRKTLPPCGRTIPPAPNWSTGEEALLPHRKMGVRLRHTPAVRSPRRSEGERARCLRVRGRAGKRAVAVPEFRWKARRFVVSGDVAEKTTTIFFSWQSDTPSSRNRQFIEDCLREAIEAIAADSTLEPADRSLALDKDTAG